MQSLYSCFPLVRKQPVVRDVLTMPVITDRSSLRQLISRCVGIGSRVYDFFDIDLIMPWIGVLMRIWNCSIMISGSVLWDAARATVPGVLLTSVF